MSEGFRGKMTWNGTKMVPVEKKRKEETHGVITDEVNFGRGIKSMVNGQIYTSKTELRRHYKRAGVIEIGNEVNYVAKSESPYQTEAYKKRLEEDSERTYYEIRDGMSPHLTELDRERCRLMDHNLEHYNYDRRIRDDDGNILE